MISAAAESHGKIAQEVNVKVRNGGRTNSAFWSLRSEGWKRRVHCRGKEVVEGLYSVNKVASVWLFECWFSSHWRRSWWTGRQMRGHRWRGWPQVRGRAFLPARSKTATNKPKISLQSIFSIVFISSVFMQIISIKDTLTDPCGGQIKKSCI